MLLLQEVNEQTYRKWPTQYLEYTGVQEMFFFFPFLNLIYMKTIPAVIESR